jgi:hypothetical protein
MLLLLLGCGANPVEKDLSINVGVEASPLRLSTLCEDATCAEVEQVHVQIVFAAGLPQTEEAELDEYRVDYELDGLKTPPYYAAKKKLLITPGETASLSLDVFGSAQRSFMIKELGHGTTTGTARLTYAGYDHDNNQILVKTRFEVAVGEIGLTSASGTTLTSPPNPLDAGSQKPSVGTPDAGTY